MADTTVLVGGDGEGLDISGQANRAEFNSSVDELDSTAFSDLCHRRVGGIVTSSFALTVLDEASTTDPWTTLKDLQGAAEAYYAWIESNASMAEGDYGVMLRALQSNFTRGGSIGALRAHEVSGNGDGQLIVCQVMQQDESLASSGNSTGFQFGALATGEVMWAQQYILSGTGTISGKLVSDDNSGFTSATDRLTFTATLAAPDAEEQTLSTATTDDWWRYEYTIATGPFTVVVLMGKALV